MSAYRCEWDLDDDELGNVQHIAQHGLSKDDVEHALEFGSAPQASRSSTRSIVFGPRLDDTLIAVIFEQIDPDDPSWIYVITAYEPTDE